MGLLDLVKFTNKKNNNKNMKKKEQLFSMKSIAKALKPAAQAAARGAVNEVTSSLSNRAPPMVGRLLSGLNGKLQRLIGSGDYEMSADVNYNSLVKPGPIRHPKHFSSGETTRIRHREYITDILTGSSAGVFSNNTFPINPGLALTFPYLASIAQNYEEYVFHGLTFEIVSTTSSYNTNSAMGSMIVSMEYNSSAPAFISKPQMENSAYAVSARFDRNILYGVECASNVQNSYYVRYSNTNAIPITATDLGYLQVATQPAATFPVNSVVGELWVSYDVELSRPRLSPARFGYFHASRTGGSSAAPMGSAQSTAQLQPVVYGSLTGTTVTGTVITIPESIQGDVYAVTVYNQGTTVAVSFPTYTLVGLAPVNIVENYTAAFMAAPNSGATASRALTTNYYVVTSSTGLASTITLGVAGVIPNGSVDVFIQCLGTGLNASSL